MKLCKNCGHCRMPMIEETDPAKYRVGGKTPKIPNPDIKTWECMAFAKIDHERVDGIGIKTGIRLCVDVLYITECQEWIKKESHMVKTPWSEGDVTKLIARQQNPTMHEHTCGDCPGVLIPTTNGWKCPDCDYKQDWCHASDINECETTLRKGGG